MSYLVDTAALLPRARALVIEHQRGSVSLVQRHLQIGYNAASELLELLQADGVVGAVGSAGEYGRAVLIAPGQNAAMAKTPAERQADFKQAMKDAGYVRLEAYVTREQREKFRHLGGDDWLRKKIDGAKPKPPQG